MPTAIVRPFARLKFSKSIATACAVVVFLALGNLASAQTDNWTGTTGVWSDTTQWDSGVPVAGDNIVIGTASASATDDFSLSVGALTLSNAADGLIIPDGV
jgi:hypothetical protein